MSESEQYKKEKEEQFGGKIRFMSYTRFIGKAGGGKSVNRGGIMFVINDTLHFEDFEKQGALLVMFNQKENYSKTEFSINLEDISIVKEVLERHADKCIRGKISEDEILPAPGGLTGLFFRKAMQVFVKNKASLFFDLLDMAAFLEILNEYMMRGE